MLSEDVMRLGVMSLALAFCIAAGNAHAGESVKPMPARRQVETVLAEVKADPDLPGTKVQKTWRLKDKPDKKETEKEEENDPSDWRAFTDFKRWITDGGRILIWLLAAVGVIWFALRVHRWVRVRAAFKAGSAAPLPSHVSSLDIRPESLPPDIGTEAMSLWQRGERRLALSLLYRAALSRLVHVDAVPIASASTEGECVTLASATLAQDRAAFFARLVGAWQIAVYGGRLPTEGRCKCCAQISAAICRNSFRPSWAQSRHDQFVPCAGRTGGAGDRPLAGHGDRMGRCRSSHAGAWRGGPQRTLRRAIAAAQAGCHGGATQVDGRVAARIGPAGAR